MTILSTEQNERTLQQLFNALVTRGGKDYALGYVFSMMHRYVDEHPELVEDVKWHLNNTLRLEAHDLWLDDDEVA